jgi:hypothetical protein
MLLHLFFGDLFKNPFGDTKKPTDIIGRSGGANNVRCMVEYTQLDLATGLKKPLNILINILLVR